VLAGVNGAGKSSLGGAAIRDLGGEYYNPDEIARNLMIANPRLAQTEANSKAWLIGKKLLEKAIANRLDFAFESTLGANTIPALLREAARKGCEVRVWYAGLSSPELHLARVKARVRKGGHDIAEADIRRRYEHSRLNLIDLLPHLAALRVYDNSTDADPAAGRAPEPVLVLHMERGQILNAADLLNSPDWAKPIVAAALKLSMG
jgi:predicted ABC-type ATPase